MPIANFVPGWNPLYAAAADARLNASGVYCLPGLPEKPVPAAISLAQHKIATYKQGNSGTCWMHSPKQLAEITMASLGYRPFAVCRRLIGYEGKRLAGGGNPSDGGSPTDAITTMTLVRGVGIAHERLAPYTDNRTVLGARPAPAVYADAKESHLAAPVKIATVKQAKAMIASGRPVANGIPWPGDWDDHRTLFDSYGDFVGGHSVLMIGYANPGVWDEHGWLQFDNWHGDLYPPLTPHQAAKVPGYRPNALARTSDFWVREDVYVRLCKNQVTEHVSATDLDGLKRGVVIAGPGFLEAFPI